MTGGRHSLYLFGTDGLADLRYFINAAPLFAFDLDGTLAPIVDNPSQITIPEEIRSGLARIMLFSPMVIVTGRARADALSHLGFAPTMVIGNHGAEGLPGQHEAEHGYLHTSEEWEKQIRRCLREDTGIIVENKGATLSLHYRDAPDRALALRLIRATVEKIVPLPRSIPGKYTENLVPIDAPDKGKALTMAMNYLGYKRALFIGDDETDEDVFRIQNDSIFTIDVGVKPHSLARYYIREQQEIRLVIGEINSTLETLKKNSMPIPQ